MSSTISGLLGTLVIIQKKVFFAFSKSEGVFSGNVQGPEGSFLTRPFLPVVGGLSLAAVTEHLW